MSQIILLKLKKSELLSYTFNKTFAKFFENFLVS